MVLNFLFDRILESKVTIARQCKKIPTNNSFGYNMIFLFVDVNEIKLQIDVCVWSKMGTLSTTTTTTSIYQLYNYADVQ